MPESEYASQQIRNKKRIIGAISIVLITIFFILAFLGYIPFLVMLIADVIVWGIANLILRRMGRITI
jgi:hypothetical protein